MKSNLSKLREKLGTAFRSNVIEATVEAILKDIIKMEKLKTGIVINGRDEVKVFVGLDEIKQLLKGKDEDI